MMAIALPHSLDLRRQLLPRGQPYRPPEKAVPVAALAKLWVGAAEAGEGGLATDCDGRWLSCPANKPT